MRFRLLLLAILIAAWTQPVAHAQASRRYPAQILALLKSGSELLKQGRLEGARSQFEKAARLEPDCPEAYNNIGLSYYRANDLDRAASAYVKALEIDPLFVPSMTNLGVIRYKQKQLDKAAKLYRVALRLTGDKDAELQYNLANVVRDQKNYTEARDLYKQAIKNKPGFYAAHNGLGATYYCLRQYDQAEKEVQRSIELKPDYALAYYHLGLIQTKQKQYRKAIKAYETSLTYETNKSYAADTRTKIDNLRKLLANAPAPGPIQSIMSAFSGKKGPEGKEKVVVLLRKGSFPSAERELQSMVKGPHASDPSVWHDYGYSLVNQNDPAKLDRAIEAYRRSLKLSDGKLPQTHYNLAQALRLKKDYKGAEEQCREAIKSAQQLQQVCPLAHNLEGILLKRRGKLKEADEAYRVALSQSMDRYPVIHFNRALLLEKLKRIKEASKEYQRYLKKAPHGLNARRASDRLQVLSR